jgi:hypothetical protein
MIRATLLLLTLYASSLEADVTVRYTAEIKSSLPAAMQQATAQLSSALPSQTILLIKGNKSFSEYGGMRFIGDSATKKVILLDTANKKYATADADEYMKAISANMPKMPDAAASMMAAFKTHVDTKATGRTETIHGIEAEEQQITISMDGPAMPNMPPGPMLRVEMHIWMSKEGEAGKIPALREWADYNQSAIANMNPTNGLKKLFGAIPGLGESMNTTFQEIMKPNSVMMRLHVEMFMPALAAMMKMAPQGNPAGAEIDPNAAMMQMTQQVADLSTEPISDSQFDVPAEYTQESADQFMKDLVARATAAAK